MLANIGDKVLVMCIDQNGNILGRLTITLRTHDLLKNHIDRAKLKARIKDRIYIHPEFLACRFTLNIYPLLTGEEIDLNNWNVILTNDGAKTMIPSGQKNKKP